MSKDWTGNNKAVFSTMAANSHSEDIRETNDFYATDPKAIDKLLQVWQGSGIIWECAAGMGHLSSKLKSIDYNGRPFFEVTASDIIIRDNLLDKDITQIDFLDNKIEGNSLQSDIVTNPPYKYAEEFIREAWRIIEEDYYICMFLPIRYLEGKKRKKLFAEIQPETIIIMSERIECAANGEFKGGGSAQGYAWFIWRKQIEQGNFFTKIEWV